ncbi:esterase [Anatilimnocola aggregata]|uniref:Esterase n=1 Tax=Anatilimnocola aggregata TaxID=2528021 RepID=A0A517Y4P4_9BACT|nr:alpha/beta hydrolase family protein [Anatilimnocola aggregata]QDU25218.1 esterase [Anatilimnocola aggregata]
MRDALLIVLAAGMFCTCSGFCAAESDASDIERGTAKYQPAEMSAELKVGERFRLPEHTFNYEMKRLDVELSNHDIWDVTFPSPVTTPHEVNNTIHCEYYRPRGAGKKPAVIVLHILGGDFALSRLFAGSLAQRGTAALFVKMPYYGPRRPPGSERRMISANPEETVAGMTQAVLDIRQATGWLMSRPEIDPEQLGIFGISLGGITGTLAASSEPRLKSVCVLLAGGDLGRIAWEAREFHRQREKLIAAGHTLADFRQAVEPIEVLNHAANCRGRRILMLNAESDEVIPKPCTEALWEAFDKPEIVWYSGGHYSVLQHFLNARGRVQDFFQPKK